MNILRGRPKRKLLNDYRDALIDMHDEKDTEPTWPAEDAALIEWLRKADVPSRFKLNPWTFVADGTQLKRNYLAVLKHGPKDGAARSVLKKVRELKARLAELESPETPQAA